MKIQNPNANPRAVSRADEILADLLGVTADQARDVADMYEHARTEAARGN